MKHDSFRALISGERRGLLAALARLGLGGLSIGYGVGVRLRNASYDAGWKSAYQATAPVISVGNLTAGGTGKTPIVAHVAGWLCDKGLRVCLISRGYRSLPGGSKAASHEPQADSLHRVNDEKLVLDRLCRGVPHIQNPDRVAAVKQALLVEPPATASVDAGSPGCHPAQAIVLDDGFQHRRLARDLDLVLIDCLNPWGYDRLLPRGLLREPVAALRRADLVIMTRCNLCDEGTRSAICRRLARLGIEQCVETAFVADRLIDAHGGTADLTLLRGQRLFAFCGIGNPRGFALALRNAGVDVVEEQLQTFPDHHHYGPRDLHRLRELARRNDADVCVTTLKDLVKIPVTELGGRPLWALSITTRIHRGEELLERRLQEIAEDAAKMDEG